MADSSCWQHLIAYGQGLTAAQQEGINGAVDNLKNGVYAHEQGRALLSPDAELSVFERGAIAEAKAKRAWRWNDQIRRLMRDIDECVKAIVDVRADAFWSLGEVEPFRKQVETDARDILQRVLACMDTRDLSLLNGTTLKEAVEGIVSQWIQKAQLEFTPALPPLAVPREAQMMENAWNQQGLEPSGDGKRKFDESCRLDPGFWRDRRAEFDVLAERQRSALGHPPRPHWLSAYCDFSKEHGEFGYCHTNGGFDGRLISDFECVVTQAAGALGCPREVEPVTFWLYHLGHDLLAAQEPQIRREFSCGGTGGGMIEGLLESSAGYCSRLEARAHRHRNDPHSRRGRLDAPGPERVDDRLVESDHPEVRKARRQQMLTAAQERWRSIAKCVVPFAWIHKAANVDHKDAYAWKNGKLSDTSVMTKNIERILQQPNPPNRPTTN